MLAEIGNGVKTVQEWMLLAKLSSTLEGLYAFRMERKREAQSKVVDVLFRRQRLEGVVA